MTPLKDLSNGAFAVMGFKHAKLHYKEGWIRRFKWVALIVTDDRMVFIYDYDFDRDIHMPIKTLEKLDLLISAME